MTRLLNRFKNIIKDNPEIAIFIRQFAEWFNTWVADVNRTPPSFDDNITAMEASHRRLVISQLREDIDRLLQIVERETNTVNRGNRPPTRPGITPEQRRQARLMQIATTYDPPGELRPTGPRHDNDFKDIPRIRIAPTQAELLSPVSTYLPVFMPEGKD